MACAWKELLTFELGICSEKLRERRIMKAVALLLIVMTLHGCASPGPETSREVESAPVATGPFRALVLIAPTP